MSKHAMLEFLNIGSRIKPYLERQIIRVLEGLINHFHGNIFKNMIDYYLIQLFFKYNVFNTDRYDDTIKRLKI